MTVGREKTLNDTLAKYRYLQLAQASDNREILHFLATVPMDTKSLTLRYSRGEDFFAFFKLQADQYFVFKFLNLDGSIGGISVIVMRKSYIAGRPTLLGYLCDLRVSPTLNKKARLEWRKCYADILKNYRQLKEFSGLEYFYSAILGENELAIKALTRNKGDIIYREIQAYKAFSLLGRVPLLSSLKKQGSRYHCRFATVDDVSLLKNFLMNQSKEKAFGDYFDSEVEDDELQRRLATWEGMKIADFILCFSAGELMGCLCPWSTKNSRKLIVDNLSLPLKILSKMLALIGCRPIIAGEELKILYLTHFEIKNWPTQREKERCFTAMLDFIYLNKVQKNYHMLSFLDFSENAFLQKVLKGKYIYQKTPALLFQVMHRDQFLEQDFLVKKNKLVSFEIGVS